MLLDCFVDLHEGRLVSSFSKHETSALFKFFKAILPFWIFIVKFCNLN